MNQVNEIGTINDVFNHFAFTIKPFFKGKDVAVIGGGNSGIEAALDLSGIVKKVTVLEFMPDLKADKILIDQAEKKDNIQILSNVQTKKICLIALLNCE